MLDQISVFAENKRGRLAFIMKLMKENGVDIRALTIADTTDFGIVRLIVDDSQKAVEILKKNDCIASAARVTAFMIDDKVGSMFEVIRILDENGINIEYCYSLMGQIAKKGEVVIKTGDVERTEELLRESGIKLLEPGDLILGAD